MNRFAIDEDAGFEIRKVFCVSESSETERKAKGWVFHRLIAVRILGQVVHTKR